MLERGLKFTQPFAIADAPVTLSSRKARLNQSGRRHKSVDDLGITYA